MPSHTHVPTSHSLAATGGLARGGATLHRWRAGGGNILPVGTGDGGGQQVCGPQARPAGCHLAALGRCPRGEGLRLQTVLSSSVLQPLERSLLYWVNRCDIETAVGRMDRGTQPQRQVPSGCCEASPPLWALHLPKRKPLGPPSLLGPNPWRQTDREAAVRHLLRGCLRHRNVDWYPQVPGLGRGSRAPGGQMGTWRRALRRPKAAAARPIAGRGWGPAAHLPAGGSTARP